MNAELVKSIMEATDPDIYQLTEALDSELYRLTEEEGVIKSLMQKTQGEIEKAKPDTNKITKIAKNFLTAVRDKLVAAGRYTKDKIKAYLQNYVPWLQQISGLSKLGVSVPA